MRLPVPSPQVGIKLASLVIHAEEAISPQGLPIDLDVFAVGMRDPDLRAYMEELDALGLLPLRREPPGSLPGVSPSPGEASE